MANKAYTVLMSAEAITDYERILHYYETHAPHIIVGYKKELVKYLSLLETSPRLFKGTDKSPQHRVLMLSRYRHKIYYEILEENETVLITALLHERQNEERWHRNFNEE